MATNRNPSNEDGESPPWLGLAKVLFVVFFTAMLFLLSRSMLRNHFFDGGQMSRQDADGQ